jgi:hypothetical protein
MSILLLETVLAATLVVVDGEERAAAWRDAAADLWPAETVEVTTVRRDEIPRFEVVDGVVSWVTARGVARREVVDPATGVLLMRSWSGTPELVGDGWIDRPAAPAAVEEGPAPRRRRRRLVEDVFIAGSVRVGVPVADAGSTVSWSIGVQQGQLVVELQGGTRGVLATEVSTVASGAVWVGWRPRRGVRPTFSVGAELQDVQFDESGRVRYQLRLLPVTAVGVEVVGKVVGLGLRVESAVSRRPFVRISMGPRIHF